MCTVSCQAREGDKIRIVGREQQLTVVIKVKPTWGKRREEGEREGGGVPCNLVFTVSPKGQMKPQVSLMKQGEQMVHA